MEFYGTLGPACRDKNILRNMFEAGMTGVRLNLSHGGLKENGILIEEMREKQQKRWGLFRKSSSTFRVRNCGLDG